MKIPKLIAGVVAAAGILSIVGTAGSASAAAPPAPTVVVPVAATPHSVVAAEPTASAATAAQPVFRPPIHLAPALIRSITGSPGHTQTILLRKLPAGVAKGRVLVSVPSAVAIHGLLVKVVTVVRTGPYYRLQVTPAKLTEALAPGHYVAKRPPAASASATEFRPSSGAAVQSLAGGLSGTISINNWMTCTGSVHNVLIKGHLWIKPSVDARFDVGWFKINAASVTASLVEDADLQASLAAAGSCHLSFPLGSLKVPFFIGPVPVEVTVDLVADATVNADGTVTLIGHQHLDATVGLTYRSGHIAGVATSNGSSYLNVQFHGSGKVEAGLKASAGVAIAGVIGPRVDGRGYVGMSANTDQVSWWRMYAGASVTGGLKIFGIDLGSIKLWATEKTLSTAVGISTATLPAAIAGVPYHAQIRAVGGKAPYTFSAGAVPFGLQMSPGGTISGTPSWQPGQPSSATLSVTVTDVDGQHSTRQFTVDVRAMAITSSHLTVNVNKAFSVQLTQQGGVDPVQWTTTDGNLPPGVTLSPSGVLSGTVGSAGTWTATLRAIDSRAVTATGQFTLSGEPDDQDPVDPIYPICLRLPDLPICN